MGNEFGSVEALWSQFEGVMATAHDGDEPEEAEGGTPGEGTVKAG